MSSNGCLLSPWSLTISCTLTEARGTATASGGGATGGGASRAGETPRGVSWSAAGAPFSAALMVGRAFQSSAGRSFLRGLVNVRESKVRLGPATQRAVSRTTQTLVLIPMEALSERIGTPGRVAFDACYAMPYRELRIAGNAPPTKPSTFFCFSRVNAGE